MAKLKKDILDLDTTLVELVFIMKGFRQEIKVYTTASQATEFVDILNENKYKNLSRAEKEMMETKYYTFDDYRKKSTITLNLNDIKVMEIPFFIDEGEEYNLKILSWKR